MSHTPPAAQSPVPSAASLPPHAPRRSAGPAWLPRAVTFWRRGYGPHDFWADLAAGVTVGVVAVPLAMAFAIASGLPPERGLFTAVVAGFLIALLSGSRFQIGGPTGAFVVIVAGVVARHGYEGLQIATLLAGGILVLMGLFRFGALIKFIPYPVVTGFTSGIALVIFSTQVRDFLGLRLAALPADFAAQWRAYAGAAGTWNPATLAVGGGALAAILLIRRYRPRIPGPIVAVVGASLAVWALGLPVETIGTRFGGIPNLLPAPALPAITLDKVRLLLPDAVTIALLAAIESLLCAVVADGMTGERHHSNTELVAQGLANVGAMLFGGLPATGALARTATSIKAGARSPLAGVLHAVTLLAILMAAAPLAVHIPLAALAAILIVAAWNMSEVDHFRHLLRAPRSDVLVMLATFGLTVAIDLTVAVQVGIVLAALLFMRRMSEVTRVGAPRWLHEEGEAWQEDPDALDYKDVPAGVEVYEINGPFFFGVADRLKDTLVNLEPAPPVFILRLRRVPAIDATGLQALEEFHAKCRRQGSVLVLSGVNAQPRRALRRIGLLARIGPEHVHPHIDAALAHARTLLARPATAG